MLCSSTFSRALAIAVALGWTAAAALGQTVISSVPYTISSTGAYVLDRNLQTSSDSAIGITIGTSNVILDLNGFYISGPPSFNSTGSAITVGVGQSNVTIRNGTLANVGYGVRFLGTAVSLNHLIENMNITRCRLAGVYFSGFTAGTVIRSNSFSQIGDALSPSGNDVYAIRSVSSSRFENNSITGVAAGNGGTAYGIRAAPGDFSIGNTISDCQVGILNGKYLNNLTSNCTTPFSGGTNATGND